ncbi:MAG: GNAT family N-acetyltransferase [Thermoplasmata archaeon]
MKRNELTIRETRREDRFELRNIARLSFDNRVYRFFALQSLRSMRNILVVGSEGRIVGFIVLKSMRIFGKGIGYIYWLAVHPEFRRRGLASRLISAAEERFKNEASSEMYASVEKENEISGYLFIKNGFEIVSKKNLRNDFGFAVLLIYLRFMIAPHELIFRKKLG